MSQLIERFGEETQKLLFAHVRTTTNAELSGIKDAIIKHGDGEFTLTYKVTIKPGVKGNSVKTVISYRPEPDVKYEEVGFANEAQKELFDEDGNRRIYEENGI